jgi:hypothetical protein
MHLSAYFFMLIIRNKVKKIKKIFLLDRLRMLIFFTIDFNKIIENTKCKSKMMSPLILLISFNDGSNFVNYL